ncbi:MAG: hypothetical protein ACRBB6_01365 [Neptuniibacter sp.]
MQLFLHQSEWIQGKQGLKDLNLMLVFQVNCPGCLGRALPLLEQLSISYPDLNVFALSTAFEDFSLNNLENTRALVSEGNLTQASARYFERLGHKKLPYDISVPVVMDWFMSDRQICSLPDQILSNMGREELSPKVTQLMKNMLNQRLLPMARTGRTFLNNQMQGTPCWYLFNGDFEILDSWFGHKDLDWVRSSIEGFTSE